MFVRWAKAAVGGLICAALSLAAAPSTVAAELRIGLAADVTSLDPHYLNVAPNNNAAWHLFDALVHVDRTRAVEPLERASPWQDVEPPETYPSAL